MGLTALIACRPGELPESVDGLIHHGWNTLESGSAEELAAVFLGLDHEVNVEKLEGEFEGELSRLTEEQAALAGVSRDASGAVGLFLSRDFDCDMASLVDVLTTVDQGALYPSGYEDYTRSYTTDRDSWDRGEEDFLRWNAQYTSSLIGATYTADVDGLLRRVNGLDADVSPGGTGVIGRLTLTEPADFEEMGQRNQLQLSTRVLLREGAGPDGASLRNMAASGHGGWCDHRRFGRPEPHLRGHVFLGRPYGGALRGANAVSATSGGVDKIETARTQPREAGFLVLGGRRFPVVVT